MFTALGAELDQALPAPAGEVGEVAPEGVHVLGADGCGKTWRWRTSITWTARGFVAGYALARTPYGARHFSNRPDPIQSHPVAMAAAAKKKDLTADAPIRAPITIFFVEAGSPDKEKEKTMRRSTWIRRRAFALGLVVGMAALVAAAAAAADDTIAARNNPAKCLHKKSGNWDNGNPIHLWDCGAGGSEMKTWVYDAGTGYIRAKENPAKCLHKKSGNWDNGNPIHLWDCDAGGPEMKTWVYDAGTGYIKAKENPAKCFHKKHGNWDNGNPIHLWDCAAGEANNKTWTFPSATASAGTAYIAIPDHPWQIENAKSSGWTCEAKAQSVKTCHKAELATLVPDHQWWMDNMAKAGWTCNGAANILRFCEKPVGGPAGTSHIAIPDHPWQIENAKSSGWTCEDKAQSVKTCHKAELATLVPDHQWWMDNMAKAGWTCNGAANVLRFCTK